MGMSSKSLSMMDSSSRQKGLWDKGLWTRKYMNMSVDTRNKLNIDVRANENNDLVSLSFFYIDYQVV